MKLSDYIKGLRKGKEAHRLEKESMKDSFLADAMDGYRQVNGEQTRNLEQLHRQVTARTSGGRRRGIVSWSVAACLVLGIGISSYFLFMKGEDVMPPVAFEEEMLSSTVRLHEEELAKSSNPADTSDTLGAPALSAPSVSKKISSDVLAQTKHVQPAPIAIADMQELVSEDMDEEAAVKTAANAKDSVIVIMYEPVRASSKVVVLPANNTVKGKVVNEQGEPVIGAVISVKGADMAALTNTEGLFELKMPEGAAELTAQYIGYQPVAIPADTGKNMLIAMKEDSQALSEIVVVGYGRIPTPLISKSEYNKYLKNNTIRPSDETCKDIKGTVILSFYVDKNGNPERITVVKGLCQSADQEAIRLVKEGPKWTPGNPPVELKIKF